MKGFFCRLYGFYGKSVIRYLKENKFKIILLSIVLIFCLFVGFLTCNKFKGDIEDSNILNIFIVKIISGDISLFSVIILQLLISVVIIAIIYLLSGSFVGIIIELLLMCLLSYIVGFDICAISIVYEFWGVVYLIICVPIVLSILLFYILIMIYFIKRQRYCSSCNIACTTYLYYLAIILIFLLILIFSLNVIFFTIRLFIVSN